MRKSPEERAQQRRIDRETLRQGQAQRRPNSVVYFVRIVRTGHIKIGYSESLRYRIHGLRSAWRSEVELLAAIPGSRRDEASIHRQLLKSRLPGMREVFYPTEPVLSYIEQLDCDLELATEDYSLEGLRPYVGRTTESFYMTPKKTRKECETILGFEDSPTRAKYKRRLALRLVQNAANGFDIAESAQIFEEFLGVHDGV